MTSKIRKNADRVSYPLCPSLLATKIGCDQNRVVNLDLCNEWYTSADGSKERTTFAKKKSSLPQLYETTAATDEAIGDPPVRGSLISLVLPRIGLRHGEVKYLE